MTPSTRYIAFYIPKCDTETKKWQNVTFSNFKVFPYGQALDGPIVGGRALLTCIAIHRVAACHVCVFVGSVMGSMQQVASRPCIHRWLTSSRAARHLVTDRLPLPVCTEPIADCLRHIPVGVSQATGGQPPAM